MRQNVRRHRVTLTGASGTGVIADQDLGYVESGFLAGIYCVSTDLVIAVTVSLIGAATGIPYATTGSAIGANTWYFPTRPNHDAANFVSGDLINVFRRMVPIGNENLKVTGGTDANNADKKLVLDIYITDSLGR